MLAIVAQEEIHDREGSGHSLTYTRMVSLQWVQRGECLEPVPCCHRGSMTPPILTPQLRVVRPGVPGGPHVPPSAPLPTLILKEMLLYGEPFSSPSPSIPSRHQPDAGSWFAGRRLRLLGHTAHLPVWRKPIYCLAQWLFGLKFQMGP